MRKNTIWACALLACLGTKALAEDTLQKITGVVVDKWGKPVAGALVTISDQKASKTYTDKSGKFVISAMNKDKLTIQSDECGEKTVAVESGKPLTVVLDYSAQYVDMGFGVRQTVEESTVSAASASNREFNTRSAHNIGNSLFGNVLGLTTLQGAGEFVNANSSFYIRGLQSLSGSSPLVLVDGIERNIDYITPEEVERVTVLKDAPAVALYGYKGINGVLNIITKRGRYNTHEIKFTYDHAINWEKRRPEFVDGYTYAQAINEALTNDGKSVRYNANELDAFKTGKYPYLYPNVNWIDEIFKNTGSTNLYNLSFRGGGTRVRYYSLLNLQMNNGFAAHPNENEGYSTQYRYSKANLRTNLDIDVTSTTKLVVNLDGVLLEASRPGMSSDNIWGRLYTIPAAAFPIKTEDGLWGGNATWGATNPVALTQARAYSKGHTRAIFADMTLNQDLSSMLTGLGATLKIAYDNVVAYWENHTKSYKYGSDMVTEWKDGVPVKTSRYTAGSESGLASDSKMDWQNKNFNFAAGLTYNNTFGDHSLSGLLMWNYEYRNSNGQNNTRYRQNVSLYAHYGYLGKYFADVTLTGSASNKLDPSARWAFSPTVSASWVLSKENFLKDVSFLNFLKLRASFGIINVDAYPYESYWMENVGGGSGYPIGGNYDWADAWAEGQLPSNGGTHERGYKYNLGLDATLFGGLNLTVDGYYQRRSRIWVYSGGNNSSVLGQNASYQNGGIVDSWGVEAGVDYTKKLGSDWLVNAGAKITLNKNEVIEQMEEPKAYDYLKSTGKPLSSSWGLEAIGFFKDQADIDNSPVQRFSEVKPGDVKYKDQNGDNIIDDNDVVTMGYSTVTPEIYFSFHAGAEYKGIGINAEFQGATHYTAYLTTQSVYWPLINNTNISTHYYENRWTPEHPNAKYPRLTAESNENNFRASSIWHEDRTFLKLRNVELYYNLPASLLKYTKFLDKAKLYVRGVDLLCFDKIKIADPEQYGATFPLNRSVVFGLAVTF